MEKKCFHFKRFMKFFTPFFMPKMFPCYYVWGNRVTTLASRPPPPPPPLAQGEQPHPHPPATRQLTIRKSRLDSKHIEKHVLPTCSQKKTQEVNLTLE